MQKSCHGGGPEGRRGSEALECNGRDTGMGRDTVAPLGLFMLFLGKYHRNIIKTGLLPSDYKSFKSLLNALGLDAFSDLSNAFMAFTQFRSGL